MSKRDGSKNPSSSSSNEQLELHTISPKEIKEIKENYNVLRQNLPHTSIEAQKTEQREQLNSRGVERVRKRIDDLKQEEQKKIDDSMSPVFKQKMDAMDREIKRKEKETKTMQERMKRKGNMWSLPQLQQQQNSNDSDDDDDD